MGVTIEDMKKYNPFQFVSEILEKKMGLYKQVGGVKIIPENVWIANSNNYAGIDNETVRPTYQTVDYISEGRYIYKAVCYKSLLVSEYKEAAKKWYVVVTF